MWIRARHAWARDQSSGSTLSYFSAMFLTASKQKHFSQGWMLTQVWWRRYCEACVLSEEHSHHKFLSTKSLLHNNPSLLLPDIPSRISHSLQHCLISSQFESWWHSGKIPWQNSHNLLIWPCISKGSILRSIDDEIDKPSFMAFFVVAVKYLLEISDYVMKRRIFLPLQNITRVHRRGGVIKNKENAYMPVGISGYSWN